MVAPVRKDALLTVVAIGLFLAPLGVPALHLSDTRYHYKRAQVTVDSPHGIAYASFSAANRISRGVPVLSRDIACSYGTNGRDCAFERYLAKNHTVPVGWATNPNQTLAGFVPNKYYRYVLINGTAYATQMIINKSVQNSNGYYRIDLALKQESTSHVLRAVALNASQQRNSIPPAVYRAATTGEATGYHAVDVPQTPIRVSNGTYYRVFLQSQSTPGPLLPMYNVLLTYGLPILGLFVLYRVFRRGYQQDTSNT